MKAAGACLLALLLFPLEDVVAAQLKAHPRLLFTAAELPALRAKAKDEEKGEMGFSASQLWQGVLRSAEVSTRNPIPPQPYAAKPGTRYPWTAICFKVPEIRRLIYTTNIIESYLSQLGKVSKNRRVFPNDVSVLKLVYLVSMDVTRRWTAKVRGWNGILAQLAIHFQGKLEGYL